MQKKSNGAPDAVAILTDDHKRVKALFKQYEKTKEEASSDDKNALVTTICSELKVHAQLEEEIFYPAAREAINDDDLLDEAEVEHASAKELIAQLDEMSPEDALYDAKVKVLGEHIDHHVKEEEGEMFPKAKKSELDTAALGEEMMTRKAALMRDMGLIEDGSDESDGDFAPATSKKQPSHGKPKAESIARKGH